jgi:hypothetical protein
MKLKRGRPRKTREMVEVEFAYQKPLPSPKVFCEDYGCELDTNIVRLVRALAWFGKAHGNGLRTLGSCAGEDGNGRFYKNAYVLFECHEKTLSRLQSAVNPETISKELFCPCGYESDEGFVFWRFVVHQGKYSLEFHYNDLDLFLKAVDDLSALIDIATQFYDNSGRANTVYLEAVTELVERMRSWEDEEPVCDACKGVHDV